MNSGRILKSLVLALSLAWLGGCDSNARVDESAAALQAKDRSLVDAGRGRIWTLTRDGLFLQQIASTERRAIALPGWVTAGPPFGAEPALALGPGGDVLVTSDVVSVVWRVDPRTLAVNVHPLALDAHQEKDVGFTSLAYSPSGGAFVATSSAPAARWRIDAALTRAERIGQ
jgi:hypothetical protein